MRTRPEEASADALNATSDSSDIDQSYDERFGSPLKIIVGAVAVLALVGIYYAVVRSGALPNLGDDQQLRRLVETWGAWGPLLIMILMAAAIVMSPIPSGPIALVAGAAYGPLLGALYIVVGAEAGAIVAFWIARCLGYESLRCWPAARRLLHKLERRRSQTGLMLAVFLSRLLPFISFDAVSYVAGLTPLTFWRFAIATLAGVIPVSFLLAYFGDRVVEAEARRIMPYVLGVGLMTLIPIAVKLALGRRRK